MPVTLTTIAKFIAAGIILATLLISSLSPVFASHNHFRKIPGSGNTVVLTQKAQR